MPTRAQHRRALQAADEVLTDLDVDQEQPIDVFDLIAQRGLWLKFAHLDNLLGAAVPVGRGGVLITTQRNRAVQRYTAAHELGHWTLDLDSDPLALDTDTDVFHPETDREILAQVFAGHLLMPPPLVYSTCAKYGISSSDHVDPVAVYQTARDMGSSYEATARQLVNLEIIPTIQLKPLLQQRPQQLKAQLAHGHVPAGNVETWVANTLADHDTITVTTGDEITLALPENRTTGHRWLTREQVRLRAQRAQHPEPRHIPATPREAHFIAGQVPVRTNAAIVRALSMLPGSSGHRRILPALHREERQPPSPSALQPDPAQLTVIDDRHQAAWAAFPARDTRTVRRALAGRRDVTLPSQVRPYVREARLQAELIPLGGTGQRRMVLKTSGEGRQTLTLAYASPYDPNEQVLATYTLTVNLVADPHTLRRRELLQADDSDAVAP